MWASAPPACLRLCVCEMSWVNQGSPSFIELHNSLPSKAGWGRHQQVLLLFSSFSEFCSLSVSPTGKFFQKLLMGVFCFVSFDSKRFIVVRAIGYKPMDAMSAGSPGELFPPTHPLAGPTPFTPSGSEESCLLGSSFPLGARLERDDHRGGVGFRSHCPSPPGGSESPCSTTQVLSVQIQ